MGGLRADNASRGSVKVGVKTEEKRPNKFLGFIFMVFGLIGFLLSIGLAIGTALLISKHYEPTTLSLLIEIFLIICSTTTLGVGMMIFKHGEFP